MKRYLVLAALAACNWTKFDDLQNSTWAHSQKVPDGVGSTDYAVAIAPVTDTSSGNAGSLAVLGTNATSYSQLDFDAKGNASNGAQNALSGDGIVQLSMQPLFIGDNAGNVVLAQGDGVAISVLYGAADMPGVTTVPSTGSADGATLMGSLLVIASGTTLISIDTSKLVPTVTTCNATASGGTMIAPVVALAHDAAAIYAWTTDGSLLSFTPPLAATTCAANATTFTATGFQPTPGSRVFIAGSHAVLVGHDASTTGQVFVADLTKTGMSGTAVLEGLDGMVSSTLAPMGTNLEYFLALGYPGRAVNGITSGQVELYTYDAMNATLDTTVVETLENAEPANGQLFGRDLTVMTFNDVGVLAVAAKGELFVYYQTLEYPVDTRHH